MMFSGGYFSSYAVDKLILAPRLTSATSIIFLQISDLCCQQQ